MKNILSIDFDYWVPQRAEFDFGHQESGIYLSLLWQVRAAQFLARGADIRDIVRISDKEDPQPNDFAEYLRSINIRTRKNNIAIAESHASILPFINSDKNIDLIHVDAHHDFGYHENLAKPDCGNWVAHLVKNRQISRIHLIYPKWRLENIDEDFTETTKNIMGEWKSIDVKVTYGIRENFPHNLRLHKTFLCRSGAWVPPWLDDIFISIALGLLNDHEIFTLGTYNNISEFRRQLNWEHVQKQADILYKTIGAMANS